MSAPEPGSVARIGAFYSWQQELLDDGDYDGWAATFAENGELWQGHRKHPLAGRRQLSGGLRSAGERLAGTGITRRHWIGPIRVTDRDGDRLTVRFTSLVIDVPEGGEPRLSLMVDGTDVLDPSENGFLVQRRTIVHIGDPRNQPCAGAIPVDQGSTGASADG